MKIRKARKEDASAVTELLYDMLGSIARSHTAATTNEEALLRLKAFILSEKNRYSYHHITVAEVDEKVVGLMLCYEGNMLQTLYEPVKRFVRAKLNNPAWEIDIETEHGDYYIDSLCVDEAYRGKGIGTALLNVAKQEAKKRKMFLSLNVEYNNVEAKKLYQRIGFQEHKTIFIDKKPFFYMKTA
ncbi:GNAT family N-acetyltransferase [Priestia megaterium]|uniref:GNAT family N-acetyltransferase n=1 Tax=Priestia megaterium TaxID=1404 RepID=UPI002E20F1A9|nr:GNAT family N-acetyltransferase [Priestia megaterium]